MDNTTNNEAVLAPVKPLHLVLNDETLTLMVSNPTLADSAAIGSEARKNLVRQTPLSLLVSDPSFKLLPAACQIEAVREAAKLQANNEQAVDGLALSEELIKPKTLAFAVWLLARKHQADLRLEHVQRLITDDNASSVFVEFTEACGMLDRLKNPSGQPS